MAMMDAGIEVTLDVVEGGAMGDCRPFAVLLLKAQCLGVAFRPAAGAGAAAANGAAAADTAAAAARSPAPDELLAANPHAGQPGASNQAQRDHGSDMHGEGVQQPPAQAAAQAAPVEAHTDVPLQLPAQHPPAAQPDAAQPDAAQPDAAQPAMPPAQPSVIAAAFQAAVQQTPTSSQAPPTQQAASPPAVRPPPGPPRRQGPPLDQAIIERLSSGRCAGKRTVAVRDAVAAEVAVQLRSSATGCGTRLFYPRTHRQARRRLPTSQHAATTRAQPRETQ